MTTDLHVHTTASDGSLAPERVVALAKDLGLHNIAITDHDTVLGVPRAIRAGRRLGLKVIPGIELSTEIGAEEIHILGYFIDYRNPRLTIGLIALRQARVSRIKKMTHLLKGLGYSISWPRVKEIAGPGSVGRPHLAKALLEKGYVAGIGEAFTHFLGRGCPAYVPRPKLTPKEALGIIAEAGGVSSLAHPADLCRERIAAMVQEGLQGLEVFYPGYSQTTICQLLRSAKKHGLIPTGGSDFHGKNREGIFLGCTSVPSENVIALEREVLF